MTAIAKHHTDITFRQATRSDRDARLMVFAHSIRDLEYRMGFRQPDNLSFTQEELAQWKEHFSPLFEHLEKHATAWVAEQDEQIVGYARAVLRGNMLELTDFFVDPTTQGIGIGRQLLAHVFPADTPYHRSIIATPDLSALARYLKGNVHIQFPIYEFAIQPPQIRDFQSDLEICEITHPESAYPIINQIDRQILEFEREVDHQWLMSHRQGFLYFRHGVAVGYGYVGSRSGPIALLDATDFPAVLAHAETLAYQRGNAEFVVSVPMANQIAVNYLLQHGFRMLNFFCYLMADKSFGQFSNYIQTNPMVIL